MSHSHSCSLDCMFVRCPCAVCFSFLHEQKGPPSHPEILSFSVRTLRHGASHPRSLGSLTLGAWSACGMPALSCACLCFCLLPALRPTAGLNIGGHWGGVLGRVVVPAALGVDSGGHGFVCERYVMIEKMNSMMPLFRPLAFLQSGT